jgi:hypothetical protein
LVIGEDDKPIFTGFAKALHAVHAPPGIAHAALKWYNEWAVEQEAQFVEADKKAEGTARVALRDEWGADYRPNLNVMKTFLGKLPEGVSAILTGARGPDGNLLLNTPDFSKWLVSHAREIDPMITLISADGEAPGKAIDTELEEIRALMRKDRKAYNANEKIQARYRELLDVRSKMLAKSKAA